MKSRNKKNSNQGALCGTVDTPTTRKEDFPPKDGKKMKPKTEYYLLVDIDSDACVSRTFYVETEVPQVYEEWVRIMDGQLDETDIKALESYAAKEPRARHDYLLQTFLKAADKTLLKRKDMAGARCICEGYKETCDGDKVVFWVNTGS